LRAATPLVSWSFRVRSSIRARSQLLSFATRELSRPSYNAGVKSGVRRDVRTQALRYGAVIATIGVITAVDFKLHVNPTTVALMFLVAVLLASAYWGLRYAVVLAA